MLKMLLRSLLVVAVVAACMLVYFCLADASSMVTWGVVLVAVGVCAMVAKRVLFAGKTPRKVSVAVTCTLVVAFFAVLAYALWRGPSSSLVADDVPKQTLRFYREGSEWYADVPGHLKSQNRMVAGADVLLDRLSAGHANVVLTFSAGLCERGEYLAWLHAVEHDEWGALYRVRVKGSVFPRMAWLCNVTHTVFGGEHPKDIFLYDIAVSD